MLQKEHIEMFNRQYQEVVAMAQSCPVERVGKHIQEMELQGNAALRLFLVQSYLDTAKKIG